VHLHPHCACHFLPPPCCAPPLCSRPPQPSPLDPCAAPALPQDRAAPSPPAQSTRTAAPVSSFFFPNVDVSLWPFSSLPDRQKESPGCCSTSPTADIVPFRWNRTLQAPPLFKLALRTLCNN
jgi:hypothetical protein